jgi:uncharacterized membrane protein YpjA
MIYQIRNATNNGYDYVELEELANTKLAENRDAYLKQEEYRFSVAKITVVGNNTTWDNADLENDLEDYVYQVFNQYTGVHEKVDSLSLAKVRRQELIDAFVVECGLQAWGVVDEITNPTNVGQPITTITEF